jgi:mannonate dehydratase
MSDFAHGELIDYHAHLVGLGQGQSGTFVHPAMLSRLHPIRHIKFRVYLSAAGISDLEKADAQYVERLVRLARGFPGGVRIHLLGFDKHYSENGIPNLEKTEFFVPNEYVWAVVSKYPDVFIATVSVHPYRPDAIESLEKWAARGVRMVKWLPNAMGMNPANRAISTFYEKMKSLDMTLLTHIGEEKAVEAGEDQRLGNPLLLRVPLEIGLRVIAAHCGSLGSNPDIERQSQPMTDNFDFFLRLMDEPRYEGLLFGDISATTQYNRLSRPLRILLERRELHARLVNGSDYPLPAINIVIRTRDLVKSGLLDSGLSRVLKEIYDFNPLLFDFVVKRSLRLPGAEEGFAASVFRGRKEFEGHTGNLGAPGES